MNVFPGNCGMTICGLEGIPGPPGPPSGSLEPVYASRFGASPLASREENTAAIQAAIDYAEAQGFAIVQLESGTYQLGRSTLNEIYDPGYVPGGIAIMMPRSDNCALILRSHVTLEGTGRYATTLDVNGDYTSSDPYKPAYINCIVAQRPDGSGIKRLGCKGKGSTNGGPAGIIQSQPDLDPAKQYCRNFTVDDVYVRDFGGYGVAIEHGSFDGVTLRNIYTYNTGADGIDTKDGNGNPGAPLAQYEAINCRMENLHPRKFGMRGDVTNAAGVEIAHGWEVSGVYAISESTQRCSGMRTRGVVDPVAVGGRRTIISDFHIEDRAANPDFTGLTLYAPDSVISNGIIEGGTPGCNVGGTNDGAADRCMISNVICRDAPEDGFLIGAGADHVTLAACSAVDCPTGYRATSGSNISLVGNHAPGCATPINFPPSMINTIQAVGNSFAVPGVAHTLITGGPLLVTGNSGAGDGVVDDPVIIKIYDLAIGTTWDGGAIASGLEFHSADASGVGAGRRAVFGTVNSLSGGSTSVQLRVVPTATGNETVGQAWFREGGSSIGHGGINPGFGSLSIEGFYQLHAIPVPPVFGEGPQYGRIFIDEADGDLKIIFANGVVKTIVANT